MCQWGENKNTCLMICSCIHTFGRPVFLFFLLVHNYVSVSYLTTIEVSLALISASPPLWEGCRQNLKPYRIWRHQILPVGIYRSVNFIQMTMANDSRSTFRSLLRSSSSLRFCWSSTGHFGDDKEVPVGHFVCIKQVDNHADTIPQVILAVNQSIQLFPIVSRLIWFSPASPHDFMLILVNLFNWKQLSL